MRILQEPLLRWNRWSRGVFLAVALGLYAVALVFVLEAPTGLGLLLPGPVEDTLQMLASSSPGARDSGHLYATTVGTVPRTTVLGLLQAAFIPAASTIPSRRLISSGGSIAQFEADGRKEMEESKAVALVAALRYAGIGALLRGNGAEVMWLSDPVPAGIARGDVILRVDSSPISTAYDLDRVASTLEPGRTARLYLLRGQLRLYTNVPVHRGGHGNPTLGIGAVTARPRVVGPDQIQIRMGDVIGPSAGLMMALAVLDRLSPRPLTGGHAVAGTGTISPSGDVGPVGGLAQKVAGAEQAGAEYFLVPPGNYEEAAGAAHHLRVVRVSSLGEAVQFLRSLPPSR